MLPILGWEPFRPVAIFGLCIHDRGSAVSVAKTSYGFRRLLEGRESCVFGRDSVTSWLFTRVYEAIVEGESWKIQIDFQVLPCPHPECNRPVFGRLSQVWKGHERPEYHYDLRESEEAVEGLLLSYFHSDRKQGVFLSEDDVVLIDSSALPASLRDNWPTVDRQLARQLGTVVGHKVMDQSTVAYGVNRNRS